MLCDNIKTIRKNRGFTQEDLAARLHVTRQTISKWEKGYSVPDAELLSRMAEELEVPVTELLGETSAPAAEMDPVVEQLSRLNEQLSIRNRRAARIWKTIGIVLAAVVVIWLVLAALCAVNFSDSALEAAGDVKWACTLDGETHTCGVYYNKDYRIVAGYTEAFFMENGVDPQSFSDARDAQAALYEWAEATGATVEVTHQDGLPLPVYAAP